MQLQVAPPLAPLAQQQQPQISAAVSTASTASATAVPVPHSNSSSSPKSSVSEAQGVSGGLGPKDTLMPKETCPVCGILITYKNLARHIKLRHKIKYKFCHR